jgi:hypothetical protein
MNERYNIFNLIHKALRAMLYDTALTLQQCDFRNREEMETAFEKVESVLKMFEVHASKEDTYILPEVFRHDPVAAAEVESEHGQDELMTMRLHHLIHSYRNATDVRFLHEAGQAILYLFIDFGAFNLSHMNKEERIINQVLWKHFTDDEIRKIDERIVQSIPAEEMMHSLHLMIRGINNPELAALLDRLKKVLQEPVYAQIWKVVEDELPVQRIDSIRSKMTQVVAA